MRWMEVPLVRFIWADCDPNLQDEDDRTPTDMALSPTTWILWCEAAGLGIKEIFQEGDKLYDIIHLPGALDSKYRRVLCTDTSP